jgi:hypothetical protein
MIFNGLELGGEHVRILAATERADRKRQSVRSPGWRRPSTGR